MKKFRNATTIDHSLPAALEARSDRPRFKRKIRNKQTENKAVNSYLVFSEPADKIAIEINNRKTQLQMHSNLKLKRHVPLNFQGTGLLFNKCGHHKQVIIR